MHSEDIGKIATYEGNEYVIYAVVSITYTSNHETDVLSYQALNSEGKLCFIPSDLKLRPATKESLKRVSKVIVHEPFVEPDMDDVFFDIEMEYTLEDLCLKTTTLFDEVMSKLDSLPTTKMHFSFQILVLSLFLTTWLNEDENIDTDTLWKETKSTADKIKIKKHEDNVVEFKRTLN